MKLVVFSHKLAWENPESPSGYATDGGFAIQMKAISEIFSETIIAVPVISGRKAAGEIYIQGNNLKVYPLSDIKSSGIKRKFNYILWFFKYVFVYNKLINNADAVHIPIPSDIGTLGMVMAQLKKKPLLVRYCGNWLVQKTTAQRIWKWYMEKTAGGRNMMLATGLEDFFPSQKNKNIRWIFSSSLSTEEISRLRKSPPVLDPVAPRLIIVGRMDEGKGHSNLIETVNLLKPKYPEIHLDLVGDGPSLNDFKELANRLNLLDNLTFHGKLNHEEVLDVLQKAHIFCFPTVSEGFPKAVLEALACGLPVLATPVSAIKGLLEQGGGILLRNSAPEVIAGEVIKVVSHPELYTEMQQKAFETAQEFTLEKWRDAIYNHLKQAWGYDKN